MGRISDLAGTPARAARLGRPAYQAASYALGRDSGYTYTVVCPAGKVRTGLGIVEDTTAGGKNQPEIRGVEIRCDALIEVPITTFA